MFSLEKHTRNDLQLSLCTADGMETSALRISSCYVALFADADTVYLLMSVPVDALPVFTDGGTETCTISRTEPVLL